MNTLRKPLFFFAIALMTMVVLVELGASMLLQNTFISASMGDAPAPGYGIPYLSLIDGIVLFTTLLIAAPLLISHRLQGRIQGIITLLAALVMLLLAIKLIFTTLISLLLMVTLLVSPIFGTVTYFALYSNFDRLGAGVVLSLLMLLKLLFAGCLLLAQQRFLQNTGLVLIILTSLLGSLIVSFLHALVPGFLVSITDAIAGIVVAILAVIWLVILLVGSLISIGKVLVGSATSVAR